MEVASDDDEGSSRLKQRERKNTGRAVGATGKRGKGGGGGKSEEGKIDPTKSLMMNRSRRRRGKSDLQFRRFAEKRDWGIQP